MEPPWEGVTKVDINHDQDGRHAHIMVKTLKNLLLQNYKSYDLETWHVASVTHDDARLTFTYFTAKSNCRYIKM